MMHIHIRTATFDDIPHMLDIEIAAESLFPITVLPLEVGRSGSPKEIRAGIRAGLAWVAEADHRKLVGLLVGGVEGSSMHILEMDVLPTHGRQGIGGKLLEHAVAQAKAMGFKEVTLTTFQFIPWNGPFYSRNGFMVASPTGRFPHLDKALQREASRGLRDRVAMYREAA